MKSDLHMLSKITDDQIAHWTNDDLEQTAQAYITAVTVVRDQLKHAQNFLARIQQEQLRRQRDGDKR